METPFAGACAGIWCAASCARHQKITIRGLAEALGISSTPVRDAVQRTVRDVRVPMLTVPQYLEITCIRAELERLAAALAAEVAQDRDVARLEKLVSRNEEAIAAKRWTQFHELNQQFHFALAEMARMQVLLDVIERPWLRMGPLLAGYCDKAMEDLMVQHHAIVAACKTGDAGAARSAIQADIEIAREGITAFITPLKSARRTRERENRLADSSPFRILFNWRKWDVRNETEKTDREYSCYTI